jgi:hypothetical protein
MVFGGSPLLDSHPFCKERVFSQVKGSTCDREEVQNADKSKTTDQEFEQKVILQFGIGSNNF